MLNSDGEIEEDLETHAERHIRTITLAQVPKLYKYNIYMYVKSSIMQFLAMLDGGRSAFPKLLYNSSTYSHVI